MLNLSQWNSHQQRLVTGSLLGAVLLAVLIWGPFWSLCLIVGLASLLGLWEFQGLVWEESLERRWQLVFLAGGALLPFSAALGGGVALHSSLVAVLFGSFLAFLIWAPEAPNAIPTLARFSLGWLYVSYLLSHALLLAGLEKGRLWLFWPLLIIFAGDMGAFYGGRRWGRSKLYEKVSPKKTREGALCGLVASLAVGMLFVIAFLSEVPRHRAILFCLLLAIIGQVGDLLESMLKRLGGKKDSSNLLPGHGGLLDRLDSLLFAFPASWYFHEWLQH